MWEHVYLMIYLWRFHPDVFQFEEELLEEAFIEACFEEMLAEEEAAQWCLFNQNGSEGSGTDVSTVEDAFKTLEVIDTSKPKEEVSFCKSSS